MNRSTLVTLIVTCLFPLLLPAQLVVNNTQTPTQLVQNVLMGGGVVVNNVQFSNGNDPNIVQMGCGSFIENNSGLSIGNGLVLSTGNVTEASGAATQGLGTGNGYGSDPDLLAISGANSINDASVLEFDLVPAGNGISVNFVFASEEYPNFVCNFNDGFGFFLSGPGINGPFTNNAVNIALVPGTNMPVTINNVNGGLGNDPNAANCPASNAQFYVNNSAGANVAFNGFTTVLQAQAAVQCGQTYHIKLAVGDANDGGFDSAVFLQGGSFTSTPISVVMPPNIMAPCMDQVQVSVQNVQGGVAPFTFQWAAQGVPAGNGPSVATIADAPHTMTVTVTDACGAQATDSMAIAIAPFALIMPQDVVLPCLSSVDLTAQLQSIGVNSGPVFSWSSGGSPAGSLQTLTVNSPAQPTLFDLNVIDQCGNTAAGSVTVSTEALPPLQVTASEDVTVFCPGDNATIEMVAAQGGQAPYTLAWIDGNVAALSTANTLVVPVPVDATYTLVITDQCGNTASDTVNTLTPHYAPLAVTTTPDRVICAGSAVELTATATGGSGVFTYGWVEVGGSGNSVTVSPEVPSSFTVQVTEACGASVTNSVNIGIETPVTNIVAINVNGDAWQFNAFSQPAAAGYDWDFGDGGSSSIAAPGHEYLDLQGHVTTLTITTANGCTATDTVHLGTEAQLFFPNAFTPDGDGFNETFGPVGSDIAEFDMTIFDRWGAEIASVKGVGSAWDGRLKNGKIAPTGVYVYSYRASGERLKEARGLGHVTLLGSESASN